MLAVPHRIAALILLVLGGCVSPPPSAPPAPINPFDHVVFHNCQEGNVCVMTLLGLPTVFGDRISVELSDIATPKINGACDKERFLARRAQTAVEGILGQAQRIQVLQPRRDRLFRLQAAVLADGRDVGEQMVERGLAVRIHDGQGRNWCAEGP